MKNKTATLLLIGIFLFGFASKLISVSAIHSVDSLRAAQSDTPRYESPAFSLLHTGSLAINPSSVDNPTLGTTPVYSLFIAAIYKVFGPDRMMLIIFQVFVSSLTALVVYAIAVRLWHWKVGLIAAVLMVLEPQQFLYSQLILSETLFTFFLACAIFLSIHFLTCTIEQRAKAAISLGFLLALATMTRPISHYLVIALILGLLVFRSQLEYSWKQLFVFTSLIVLPSMLITGAWQIRNGLLTDVYEINSAKSSTMLYYKAKGVLMTRQSISSEEAHQQIIARLPAEFESHKSKLDHEGKLAREIIFEDPGSYLRLTLEGIKNIIFGVGLASQAEYYGGKLQSRPGADIDQNIFDSLEAKTGYKIWFILVVAYAGIMMMSVYGLAITGFVHTLVRAEHSWVLHLLLLGFVAYFVLISSGHIAAYSRMRVPVIPIFIVYAAYGAHICYQHTLDRYSIHKVRN